MYSPRSGILEIFDNIFGAVLPEHAVLDAGSIVDDNLRLTHLRHGFFQGSFKRGIVAYVGGVGVNFGRWSGRAEVTNEASRERFDAEREKRAIWVKALVAKRRAGWEPIMGPEPTMKIGLGEDMVNGTLNR